MLYNY